MIRLPFVIMFVKCEKCGFYLKENRDYTPSEDKWKCSKCGCEEVTIIPKSRYDPTKHNPRPT